MSDATDLADEYWRYVQSTAQFWNLDRGDVDQIDQWEDLSPSGVESRLEHLGRFCQRADALPGELTDHEQTLLAALSFNAQATASLLPFDRDLSLVGGPFNVAAQMNVLVPGYSLTTRHHGAGYVAKVRAIPEFLDGWVAGLRDGLSVGRVATARGVRAAIAACDAMLAVDPADDPMAEQEPPREMSHAETAVWRGHVVGAIRDARPSVGALRDALITDILPAARSDDQAGVCHIADGDRAYVGLLHASTSTDLTPQAIHQIGLQQLAALDDEYRVLGGSTMGVDDPREVRNRLRDDPSLRYATSDQIVADAMAALDRAQTEAPAWFQPMPQQRCAAVAVAAGAMAFYTGPSPDGARGGTFFFNTADPTAWTRFQLEVTTFHESVPGHHLQLALANELDLHPLLGELEVTAFGEGWGLYAERLADEMSLYSSPLQRLGMVTLDSLRAVRLVVDTGIHAMGWTRDRAIEFFDEHTAQDRRNAAVEVDRYIAVPGQATSYMIGRLEIERLRDRARASMGDRFTIADFHRVVLGSGMTPLDELARTVERWIAT